MVRATLNFNCYIDLSQDWNIPVLRNMVVNDRDYINILNHRHERKSQNTCICEHLKFTNQLCFLEARHFFYIKICWVLNIYILIDWRNLPYVRPFLWENFEALNVVIALIRTLVCTRVPQWTSWIDAFARLKGKYIE